MDDTVKTKGWRQTLALYFQLPMLTVFILGMASGFPLLLTGSTLATRLFEADIDIKHIGAFALVGLPYTFKFLWAPFVDSLKLGKTHLEHRRTWLWLTQSILGLSLLAMAWCDPAAHLTPMAALAIAVSVFSATQDIVIDALRVEMLPKEDQGAGAAMSVAGYRVGMLFAGAGALLAATWLTWPVVYALSALFMLFCMPAALMIKKLYGMKKQARKKTRLAVNTQTYAQLRIEDDGQTITAQPIDKDTPSLHNLEQRHGFIFHTLVAPLTDFFNKRGIPAALRILLFILLFKLGDAMAGSLSMPFYLAMGFSKPEIVAVSKVIGFGAIFLGTMLGGFIVKHMSLGKALFLCGTVQLLSNFVFVWLANVGHSLPVLVTAICVENITGGMGTAAFVAFMASLCNIEFTATQYALFSALSSVGRTVFASSSGMIVSLLGWGGFYMSTALFALPGMLLLAVLRPVLEKTNNPQDMAA